VRPIEFIGRLLTPVVWFLTAVTTFITRVLGVRDVDRDR
jgi:CBS domain containing-hemolysin-like protein